jgi:hypothetical protein
MTVTFAEALDPVLRGIIAALRTSSSLSGLVHARGAISERPFWWIAFAKKISRLLRTFALENS